MRRRTSRGLPEPEWYLPDAADSSAKSLFAQPKQTQSSAANAEESAAAAQQLNAQACSVKSDVFELLTLVGGGRDAGK